MIPRTVYRSLAVDQMANSDKIVVSELLCFLSNKCGQVSFEKLVNITSKFYSWDEIAQAKGQLMVDVRACSSDLEARFVKRKGADKETNTVSDMLKCILDPQFVLPKYVALALSRIPPVGFEDVDAVNVCNDLAAIKLQLKELMTWKAGLEVRNTNVASGAPSIVSGAPSTSNVVMNDTRCSTRVMECALVNESDQTFAKAVAGGAASEGSTADLRDNAKPRKLVKKINMGKATTSSLRVAVRRKSFDLYLSGLEPDELVERVTDVVKANLPGLAVEVSGERLKTRSIHYSSFHVKVQGPEDLVKQAAVILESADSWDEGIVFRRFWIKK